MELRERRNDSTHHNLGGGMESRFPLTVVSMPFSNERTDGFSKLSSSGGQDAESKLGRHDPAVG
jgi:hypothetical protein